MNFSEEEKSIREVEAHGSRHESKVNYYRAPENEERSSGKWSDRVLFWQLQCEELHVVIPQQNSITGENSLKSQPIKVPGNCSYSEGRNIYSGKFIKFSKNSERV